VHGVCGTAGVKNRGVFGIAPASTGGSNYAIYGFAAGTSDNDWGGYFYGRGYFSGNVGIGIDQPVNKLDIVGNLAVGSYAGLDAAPANGLIVSGTAGIGISSPTAKLHVYSTDASNFLNALGNNEHTAIVGDMEYAGNGENVGIYGYAGQNTVANYGIVGMCGGNASNNIAIYGYTPSSNGGFNAAVYAYAGGISNNDWAGYFIGRGYFSDKVGIGTLTPGTSLDVNGGDIRTSNNVIVQGTNGIIRNNSGTQLKKVTTIITINLTLTGGQSTSIPITWSEAFTATPEAYVGDVTSGSVGGWAELVLTVTGTTSTGATLWIHNTKATTTTPNYYINIIAIGAQ